MCGWSDFNSPMHMMNYSTSDFRMLYCGYGNCCGSIFSYLLNIIFTPLDIQDITLSRGSIRQHPDGEARSQTRHRREGALADRVQTKRIMWVAPNAPEAAHTGWSNHPLPRPDVRGPKRAKFE